MQSGAGLTGLAVVRHFHASEAPVESGVAVRDNPDLADRAERLEPGLNVLAAGME